MKVKEKDFIEIDFTARTEQGKVFDTTQEKEAVKAGLPKAEYKPLQICVGEGYLLKGLDKALEDKEVGKGYEITLKPEEAFGKRKSELVKIIPLKIFHEKKINPYPGLPLALDNTIATVRAVSGGRVITDFNHPLAGKKIIYKIIIRKKIEKPEEKIRILLKRYLNTEKFEIKEKKIIVETKLDMPIKEAEKKIKELVGDYTLKVKEGKEEETKKKAKEKEEETHEETKSKEEKSGEKKEKGKLEKEKKGEKPKAETKVRKIKEKQ